MPRRENPDMYAPLLIFFVLCSPQALWLRRGRGTARTRGLHRHIIMLSLRAITSLDESEARLIKHM